MLHDCYRVFDDPPGPRACLATQLMLEICQYPSGCKLYMSPKNNIAFLKPRWFFPSLNAIRGIKWRKKLFRRFAKGLFVTKTWRASKRMRAPRMLRLHSGTSGYQIAALCCIMTHSVYHRASACHDFPWHLCPLRRKWKQLGHQNGTSTFCVNLRRDRRAWNNAFFALRNAFVSFYRLQIKIQIGRWNWLLVYKLDW